MLTLHTQDQIIERRHTHTQREREVETKASTCEPINGKGRAPRYLLQGSRLIDDGRRNRPLCALQRKMEENQTSELTKRCESADSNRIGTQGNAVDANYALKAARREE